MNRTGWSFATDKTQIRTDEAGCAKAGVYWESEAPAEPFRSGFATHEAQPELCPAVRRNPAAGQGFVDELWLEGGAFRVDYHNSHLTPYPPAVARGGLSCQLSVCSVQLCGFA